MMKSFYDYLQEEINGLEGCFDQFILYIPDFFILLCDLLRQNIDSDDRRLINSALAYFVVPNDRIYEEIYGPMGYVDDIYVCTLVLNKIRDKYGYEFLEQLWDHEEKLDHVLDYSYNKSLQLLGDQDLIKEILKYSGLE
jgi:uncharacterized membrane protein YkvA (DUF1232 family)